MNELRTVDESLGDVVRVQDVVDRETLNELCRSFHALFGISVRIVSRDGSLLADVHEQQAICGYVNGLARGRSACGATVTSVKALDAGHDTVIHGCFTGAVYRVVSIEYQGQRVGRVILGPYLSADVEEVPRSLLRVDPDLDPDVARERLESMPRVREETAERIAKHLLSTLDIVLFSNHRARLTSSLHVASVRESYRELAEKTAELQKAYDRLRELDRLKSNFLATVSHELRTPLTSIIGYSEMLENGMAGQLSAEQLEFVRTIRGKGDQLLRLITTLLDLSKLEQGHQMLHLEPFDAAQLIEEVAETLKPAAERYGVTLTTRVEAGVPSLSADIVRVKQILINLADNAVKFTPAGGQVEIGVRGTVVSDESDGGLGLALMAAERPAVEFWVRDTGIGIPRSELPRIFDAFYQVDGGTTRQHGGAGLGLSIVKRLVEAHGGRIDVESELDQGTTFTVVLPESRSE